MAFDYDDSLVLYAQKYITGLLEAKASKETVGPVWGSESLDLDPGEYGLIVSKGNKRIAYTFTKTELTAGYGTMIWAEKLQAKVNTILRRIGR
jgi:hypothetical protein